MKGVLVLVSQEDKTLALLSHVLTLLGLSFLPGLIIWLMKKDQSLYVAEHAKESLNFQISLIIYGIISGILMFVLIGIVLMFALGIFAFVVVLMATIKAANGEPYRYPLSIRFIK
jgi:uncharacterized Tic20 family protein